MVVSAPLTVNGNIMPLRSLSIQTVLTRSMGPISSWRSHFSKLAQLGYNAIHFTSLNEIGVSRSAYSIRNHLDFDPSLFEDGKSAKPANRDERSKSVLEAFTSMEKDFDLAGIVDVVWNHTSCDTPWLGDHPEATYNVENSGHLKAALLLDEALQKFSEDLTQGVFESRGLGRAVRSEDDLTKMCQILQGDIFPALKLWEFYVVDVDNAIQEFEAAVEATDRHDGTTLYLGNEVESLKKHALTRDTWARGSLKIDVAWAIKLFAPSAMRRIDYSRLHQKTQDYRSALNQINLPLYEKLNEDVGAALSNIANRVRYERLSSDGPKLNETSHQPLIAPYFTRVKYGANVKTHQEYYMAANNGWVWGGNPTQNFAEFPGSAYLRRELIVWGDLVKLRYGAQPSDSPWLWEYMREYTTIQARLFHGFRIDNCHSTPIHVARIMLDAARTVRPGLYVSAELFTGTEKFDNLYVAKLGINSLIREAMQCSSPGDLSSTIHRYGGETIASLMTRFPPEFYSLDAYNRALSKGLLPSAITGTEPVSPAASAELARIIGEEGVLKHSSEQNHVSDTQKLLHSQSTPLSHSSVGIPIDSPSLVSSSVGIKAHGGRAMLNSSFFGPIPTMSPMASLQHALSSEEWFQPVQTSTPPALLFDCTHDNQTPWVKRTAEDYLPNMALVAMARLPIGSVAGYDWIVSHNPHVIDERLYPSFADEEMVGIMNARRFFNHLHQRLESEGYTQIHVHQEGDLLTIQRHHPHSHRAVFCIAHTSFYPGNKGNRTPSVVQIPGSITKFSYCARLSFDENDCADFYKNVDQSHARAARASSGSYTPSGSSETSSNESPSPSPAPFIKNPSIHGSASKRSDADANLILGEPSLLLEIPQSDLDAATANLLQSYHHTDANASQEDIGLSGAGGFGGNPLSSSALNSLFSVAPINHSSIEVLQQITWKDFRPGSVLVLEAQLPSEAHSAMSRLRHNLRLPMTLTPRSTTENHQETEDTIVGRISRSAIFSREGHLLHLTALDANYALYRCEAEERSSSGGERGTYGLPGYGDLVYAGLQGVVSVLEKVRASKDMGHSLCTNLRNGNWLMDYIVSRFDGDVASKAVETDLFGARESLQTLRNLGVWLHEQFALVKLMPRYLVPRCFDAVVMKAYMTIRHHILQEIDGPLKALATPRSSNPSTGHSANYEHTNALVRALTLTSVQLVAALPTVSLLDPSITGDSKMFRATMAAGLPHFSHGYMRSWGRDTFIAFRGLLLLPGRFDVAKETLVGFAATLRHGLIPNLIDSGWNPRFNARDSTWWFLHALQQYCLLAPEGHLFLSERCIPRLYPTDDTIVRPGSNVMEDEDRLVTPADIIQEIMERHACGIHFRERNAGTSIDSHMHDRGFNIDIELDLETGFIHGGNQHNCGTWMDKMGSNHGAGNHGVPATPRDGAAIELVALLKSTVRWLAAISQSQVTNPPPSALERSGSLKLGRSGSFSASSGSGLGTSGNVASGSGITISGTSPISVSSTPPIHTSSSPIHTASSTLSPGNSPIPPTTPVLASPSVSAPPKSPSEETGNSLSQFKIALSDTLTSSNSSSPNALSNVVLTNTHTTAAGTVVSKEVNISDHENLKFSAPPEELPSSPAFSLQNLPPPLFADAARKTKASASSTLEDFLKAKKSTVSVAPVAELPRGTNYYPYQGVTIQRADGTHTYWSWSDWELRLQSNFEKCFYIPRDPRQDSQYRLTRQYIARRGIYKDTYKASQKFTDYQLRPNLCVAMVVAPELFTPEHAVEALEHVTTHILGPLGMRTLDPGDTHYRGYYDNNNQSDDYYMASGFSYHLGPEWVWLMGFYLRARLQFRARPLVVVLNQLQRILQVHAEHAHGSDWQGLPELTNKDGAFCPGSCTTQAWSSATLLEALYDLHNC